MPPCSHVFSPEEVFISTDIYNRPSRAAMMTHNDNEHPPPPPAQPQPSRLSSAGARILRGSWGWATPTTEGTACPRWETTYRRWSWGRIAPLWPCRRRATGHASSLIPVHTCSYCLSLVPSRFMQALLSLVFLLGVQRSIVAGSDRELATPPVEEATPRTKTPGVRLFPAAFRYCCCYCCCCLDQPGVVFLQSVVRRPSPLSLPKA